MHVYPLVILLVLFEYGYACIAIAKTTGKLCRINWGIDSDGYCGVHRKSQPKASPSLKHLIKPIEPVFPEPVISISEPGIYDQCLGYRSNGAKCTARQKYGTNYCCSKHNPDIVTTDPVIVRLPFTGSERKVLLKAHDFTDQYSKTVLSFDSDYHVEHITECQMFVKTADMLRPAGTKFSMKKERLFEFIRHHIANEPENLCVTEGPTNTSKGNAVYNYLEDKIHNAETKELVHYLDKKGLSRKITFNIRKEMYQAAYACIDKFEDEQPLHEAMMNSLQEMITDMKLK